MNIPKALLKIADTICHIRGKDDMRRNLINYQLLADDSQHNEGSLQGCYPRRNNS